MVKDRGAPAAGKGSKKPGLKLNKTKKKLKEDEYECAACHKVFTKGVSDEEALEEAATLFPTVPIEDTSLVCDDCFQKMMSDVKERPWAYPPLPPEDKE
jgi:hypothetical protein